MTWTRAKATGGGKLSYRLSIAGWPYEFVSRAGMVSSVYSSTSILPAAGSETWTASGAVVTTGQADPLGGTNAVSIADDSAAAEEYANCDSVSYTSGTAFSGEIWVKHGTSAACGIYVYGTGLGLVNGLALNTATGAISVLAGSFESYEATQAVAGWWRVRWRHAGLAETAIRIRVYPDRGSPTSVTTTGTAVVYAPALYLADGRQRILGLNTAGLKLEDKLDVLSGRLRSSGLQITIADVGELVTLAFAKRPTSTTYLRTTCDDNDTTINVTSTTGLDASGTVWIDGEAITYTGVTSNTLTGCTRGVYNTLASWHYYVPESGLARPLVTNYPRLMRGRRARLYAYGAGDDPQGNGTQVWIGTVTGEPSYDGTAWSVSIDPITSILDQDLAGDLGAPVSARGIYFPDSDAFGFIVRQSTTSGAIGHTSGVVDVSAQIGPLSGFFETQEAFCAAVQAEIDTEVNGDPSFLTKLYIVSDGPSGYHFEIRTDASARYLQVGEVFPWHTEPRFAEHLGNSLATTEFSGRETLTVASNRTYFIYGEDSVTAGHDTYERLGSVPRGAGIGDGSTRGLRTSTGSFPNLRVYVDGVTTIPSYTTRALVKLGSGDEEERPVTSVDATDRFIQLGTVTTSPESVWAPSFRGATDIEIRLGRSYDATPGDLTNSVADLLAALVAGSAAYGTAGAQPIIESGDIDQTAWDAAFAGLPRYLTWRNYSLFSPVKLADLVRAELQLAGFVLALDATGRMVPRELRLPLPSDVATREITASEILTDNGLPTYERAGIGLINTVIVKTGYSPQEDEWKGPDIIVKDTAARGEAPTAQKLLIEPRSRVPIARPGAVMLDLIGSAQRLLGLFAQPYASSTMDVPLTCIDSTTVGSIIRITSKHIPSDNGTKGSDRRAAIVAAREQRLNEARCRLTLLLAPEGRGGYAPAAKVSSQTNTSGNTWEITVATTHFPSGTDAADFFAANDRVRVRKWDSATPGTVVGIVTAASGNVVTVAFAASWTPGADTWMLGYDVSSYPVEETQRVHVFIGDADARVTFDSANDRDAYPFV